MRRTVQNPAAVDRGSHLCRRTVRRERWRDSVQQATEAERLTRTCDSKCAEQSKTRPPSYVPVTLVVCYVCRPNFKEATVTWNVEKRCKYIKWNQVVQDNVY